MSGPFELSKEMGALRSGIKLGSWAYKIGRRWGANRQRAELTEKYGAETAEAVVDAIAAGRDPSPILARAEQLKKEREDREALLKNPPPIHGTAAWARRDQLSAFLGGWEAFEHSSSILLGTYQETPAAPVEFVHWDGDGHLLTLAPTRTGKSVTTIIPNLLRYRGSAIVFDPKGELYETTSKWRAENVGPVYRIAPFDDGSDPKTADFPIHGFNPLSEVQSQYDARAIAQLMFPKEEHTTDFFNNDAVNFLTAVIQFVLSASPPDRRHLGTVRGAVSSETKDFLKLVQAMQQSPVPSIREAANNVHGKSKDRGLPNLRDTLHSKLALWSDPAVRAVVTRNDFRFRSLKDQPSTVYITVPFKLIEPYAPFLRVMLQSALDAMIANPAKPEISVLFVLDEFLSLGPFPEFRNAIRTHASAGVRLWFFLQDLGELQINYPGTSWQAFFNTSARQFFGIDDPFTAELIASGKYLGNQTVAYRSTQSGANTTAQLGTWTEAGSSGLSVSNGESIQLVSRPLMTPDELMEELSGWKANNTRVGIVHLRGPRPFKVHLVPFEYSDRCMSRIGAYRVRGSNYGAGHL